MDPQWNRYRHVYYSVHMRCSLCSNASSLIYARTRTITTHVGGAESAMAKAADKLTLQMEAQKLADRQTEFVVNSKEELVGIMKCTACKRVILQLHSQIIGRVSTEGGASVKKITKRLSKMIKKICHDQYIQKLLRMQEFIKENENCYWKHICRELLRP